MNTFLSVIFILVLILALSGKKHKLLFFLSILSIFSDIFFIDLGARIQLINLIGFFVIPLIVSSYLNEKSTYFTKSTFYILKPLWLNLLYLVILGIIFGFMLPWSDGSNYRTWAQDSQGRTIITIVRYLNEFLIALYVIWIISTRRVNLRFVVYSIGWITLFSFAVAIIEYYTGPIIRTVIQNNPNVLEGRFLGLSGEPKIFGRNAALAYVILFVYYLKIEKNKKLLVFILINTFAVILSLSASSYIIFALFNIYIIIDQKKIKYLVLLISMFLTTYLIISKNPNFNSTKFKIEKAIVGSDVSDDSSMGMSIISRFDVFDHLALLFLLENPTYILTGTGPNLISIPASKYLRDYPQYAFYDEIGGIDSVPNVMFNNVLSNSGIIGLFLFFLFFVRFYRFSKHDKSGFSKNLVVIALIFNMVYFSIVLLFLTGIVVGNVCKQVPQKGNN